MSLPKYIVVAVFFFLGIAQVRAQKVPGYMGKRLAFGLSYDYAPAIAPLIISTESANDNELLNITLMSMVTSTPRIGAFGRFVVSDQSTFDVSFNTQGITYVTNREVDDYSWSSSPTYTIDYAKSRTNSLTIGMSTHPQNIAPVGSYYSFGLILSQTSVSYKEKNSNEETLSNVDIGYHGAVGVRRVFKDKVMAEFGINYNLYFGGFFTSGRFSGFEQKQDNANNYLNYAYSANAWNNLLVLHLGVAYLL